MYRMKIAPLLLFILLAGSTAQAQNADTQTAADADALYQDAVEAQYAQFWERAIDLFKEGSAQYPDDVRFPWALGSLYYSRSLYGLAWDEYRRAERIDPVDTGLLLQLAHTAGYLNRDNTSVEYLEKLLAIDPNHKEAISSLGWMYYKVHRLGEGERLLNAAIERFGDDPDFAMTLGTVYSDMYYYDEGKYWYRKAIAQGETLRDRVFTAVARYNLSILESRFYRYDLSLDEANASLDSQNRASGHLSRGEIYLRRLDLRRARTDYETAYEIDTSPLAKINLAQIYQVSGKLEESRRYAEDCLKGSDLSWMLNYGIDPDRYKRDIHEILYKAYSGLAQTERLTPWGRPGEQIRSLFRLISYRFKSAVHRSLYQKYSLAAGNAYGAEKFAADGGFPLDSFIQYYNAFESYPRRALAYLNTARDFETTIIPAAAPSYNFEAGILLKDTDLVSQALAFLDPVWERELISQCYREFARRGGVGKTRQAREVFRRAAAEELFALNRGALRQAGVALPLTVSVSHDLNEVAAISKIRRSERLLRAALAKAGFTHVAANAPDTAAEPETTGPRFALNVSVTGSAASGYVAACELVDTAGVERTLRQSVPLRSLSGAALCDAARVLSDAVFKIE